VPYETRQELDRRRYIDSAEFKRLLSAAKRDREAYTCFCVCSDLGLRIGEFHRILECDVSKGTNEVMIRTEKQKKGRWKRVKSPVTGRVRKEWVPNPRVNVIDLMHAPEATVKMLRQWIVDRKIEKGAPLFQWTVRRSQKLFDKYATKAGIKVVAEGRMKGRGVHCLRHYRALEMAAAGCSAVEIRDFLRQRSITSTDVYMHSTRLKEIAKKMGVVRED
jgi:integrase